MDENTKGKFIFKRIRNALDRNNLQELNKILKTDDIMGWTSLHFAVYDQNIALIEEILKQTPDSIINKEDNFKRTPLSIASYQNNLNIMKLLIKNGANTNLGYPLHFACEKGNTDCIKYLLKQSCNVNSKNNNGNFALLIATKQNHFDAVKILIKYDANLNIYNTNEKETALHIACHNANFEIAEILLKSGALIDVLDKYQSTPLACVIFSNEKAHKKIAVAKLLLENNASPNYQKQYYLHNAEEPEIITELLKYGADIYEINDEGESVVLKHCYRNHIDVIKILLQIPGLDFDKMRCWGGWSPLHVAAFNGNKSIVEELIRAKIDVNIMSACNVIPLHLAAVNGYYDIAEILLKSGSLINVKATRLYDLYTRLPGFMDEEWFVEGATPLSLAARNNHLELCRLLLENGAKITQDLREILKDYNSTPKSDWPCSKSIDLIHCNDLEAFTSLNIDSLRDDRDSIGWTCLHHSTYIGNLAISSYLIKNGVTPVDSLDNFNRTPLTIAAFKNDLNHLKLFLNSGADINLGLALHAAVLNDSHDCIKELMQRGIDSDSHDYPAVIQACVQSKTKSVQTLLGSGNININCVNKKCCNETPLIYACRNSDYDIARILIENGADVNIDDNTKSTAILEASIFNVFQPDKTKYENLMWLLLDSGVNVECQDQFLSTPLHCAVDFKDASRDIVAKLIENMSDIDMCNDDGETALFLAIKPEIVELLIDRGADVNIVLDGGETLLHRIARDQEMPVLRHLLKYYRDFNINAAMANNILPIHCAIIGDDVSLQEIQEMIDFGAYLDMPVFDLPLNNRRYQGHNTKFYTGNTPIICAAAKGNLEAVQLLKLYGVDLDDANLKGNTALHEAVSNNHLEVVRFLLENQAKTDVINKLNKTAFNIAKDMKNHNIIDLFENLIA